MQLRRMFQIFIPNNNVRSTKEYDVKGGKKNLLLWKVFRGESLASASQFRDTIPFEFILFI